MPFEFLDLLGRTSIEAVLPADHIRLDMTIVFADLRDFTATSESLGAERAFALLNEYLQAMEPEISACHGFINQYLGDGFVALFPRGADNAVAAAIGMGRALADLNANRMARGEAPLRIGIGINSGELMLGAIGGEQRLDGNVVGDAVNLASRVEGLTKLYGATCVVTDATVARLSEPARYALRELDRVVVVGRTTPVVIYELLDLDPRGTARRQAGRGRGLPGRPRVVSRRRFRSRRGGVRSVPESLCRRPRGSALRAALHRVGSGTRLPAAGMASPCWTASSRTSSARDRDPAPKTGIESTTFASPMSVLGHSRRFRDVRRMSGLPRTADISGAGRHFAFGPKSEVSTLKLEPKPVVYMPKGR